MLNISFYLTLSSKISKLLILTPLLRNGCFFGVSPILLTQHPVRLRDTAGEEGEMYFFALISVKCDTIGGEIAFFFFGI